LETGDVPPSAFQPDKTAVNKARELKVGKVLKNI